RDKAEVERVRRLISTASTSPSDVDKAVASLKVDEAQVDVSKANEAAAEAELVKAEENLKYCTIAAPATGRLGQSLVSAGTMVDAYKTELVSVYPINPVYAVWDVDELTSLWFRGQIRAGVFGDPRNPATPVQCIIKLKNEKEF